MIITPTHGLKEHLERSVNLTNSISLSISPMVWIQGQFKLYHTGKYIFGVCWSHMDSIPSSYFHWAFLNGVSEVRVLCQLRVSCFSWTSFFQVTLCCSQIRLFSLRQDSFSISFKRVTLSNGNPLFRLYLNISFTFWISGSSDMDKGQGRHVFTCGERWLEYQCYSRQWWPNLFSLYVCSALEKSIMNCIMLCGLGAETPCLQLP